MNQTHTTLRTLKLIEFNFLLVLQLLILIFRSTLKGAAVTVCLSVTAAPVKVGRKIWNKKQENKRPTSASLTP